MKSVRRAIWTVTIVALAFLAWIAFVGDLSPQELAIGAACALLCGAASLLTWRAMDLSIAFNLRDMMEMWRLPWNAAHDAWLITCALFLDLLHIKRAGSHLRAIPFEDHRGRRGCLRHVLTVACTSVTPNSIVIGIDDKQGLMLIHQIVRSDISELTRRLGAQA